MRSGDGIGLGETTRSEAVDEREAFSVADSVGDVPAPFAAGRRLAPAAPAPRSISPAANAPAGTATAMAALRHAVAHERDIGAGFHLIPVFLCLGAFGYYGLSREPGLALMLAALGCGIAAAILLRRWQPFHLAAMALAIMLGGAVAAKLEVMRAGTPMLGAEISTRLTARVVDIERQANGRIRLTLDVLATERPQLRYAPERVRATARTLPDGVQIGDVVAGAVRLFPSSGPVRPQSYDFAFRNYFNGIGASGFFLSGPEPVAGAEARFGEASWTERAMRHLANWRAGVARHIADRIGGAEGEIAAALITGVRAGIPERVNDALRVTGLYHIVSISGLHMALVAGTVMVALRSLFALMPGFAMRHPVKKYAAAIALVATAAYLVVSGSEVAAERSFIMLAVMLMAVLFDRAAITMRNLALSAIIIILISPHEVAGPSFQMSFAATAALVATYAGWSQFAERRRPGTHGTGAGIAASVARKGTGYIGALALTSIVAGAATALFTAWHFQQVSPLGLVANLAVMPIVSVIVMPMAVLACLLMPFGLDGPALDLMGQGIAAMNAIAFWLAGRSMFDVTGTVPLAAVLLLTAALALMTLLRGRLRWSAVPLLAGGAMLLVSHEVPDIFVSEDGRLVAVRLVDKRVAVNRARPNAFTMENWTRAMAASAVVAPAKPGEATGNGTAFTCTAGTCTIAHPSGLVAHVGSADAARELCDDTMLIVIDDATAENPCAGARPIVLTKRDLARKGSAEISVDAPAAGVAHASLRKPRLDLRFAIAEPYRPWHAHRRYSREARGLPPWQPKQRNAASNPAEDTANEGSAQ